MFLLGSVGWAMAKNDEGGSGGSSTEINSLQALKDAISSAEVNATIKLTGDIMDASAESGSAITINKALTLDGNGKTISGSAAQNIIAITGSGAVTIKNVTIKNNMGSSTASHNDVTVYRRGTDDANAVTFENVTFAGNGWIGLVVNGSAVTVDGITDNDTHVYGTINLENRAQGQENVAPKLTIVQTTRTPNTLNGLLQIYVDQNNDIKENISSWVDDKTSSFTYMEAARIWTNRFNNGQYTIPVPEGRTSHATELLLLMDIINNAETGISTVALGEGTYTLGKQLVIKKRLMLKGQGSASNIILEADQTANWPKNDKGNIISSSANLISIEALGSSTDGSTVDLMNLTVRKSMASGINAQSQIRTHLNCVNLEENTNAGLLVHSKVDIDNVHTKLNGWGAINVDKGDPDYGTTQLTVNEGEHSHSTFEEIVKIWGEGYDKNKPNEHFERVYEKVTMPAGWSYTYDATKNMYFWTNSVLTTEKVDGVLYVFANGNAVTVSATDDNNTKIAVSESDFLVCPNTTAVYLYGGSKDASVTSTSITMTGGQLARIYGGGYASSDGVVANVNTATINITGGEISDALTLGGVRRSKVTSATVTVTGSSEDAKIKVNTFVVGGFASPGTDNRVNTWETANCGVQNATIALKNVDIKYMGAGGGQGYSYTGSTNVSVENATINSAYGTLYNGYADNIEASFKNVKFSGEFATINRGAVGSADFTFDGCTLNANAINCIGAATGWAGSDTDGSDAPEVSGPVTYTFTNMSTVPTIYVGEGLTNANVTVTGAPVKIAKFDKGLPKKPVSGFQQYLTDFVIGSGKTWTFNKGYEIAEGASLTRTGKLIVGVDTEAALQAAVALDADTIKLAANEFKLSQQLLLKKTVALVGTISGTDSTKLVYSDSFKGGTAGDSKHMISVQANNVLLQNLVVDGTDHNTDKQANSGSAINVYKATGVVLDNVIARNTIAAGLIVNGSTVTATNFHTEGNGWYGVNVDKGDGVEGTPVFRIGDNCSFAENVAIFADLKNAPSDDPSKYVVSSDWAMQKVTSGEGESTSTAYRWVNTASQGINYAIISVPATVVYGEANLPLLSNITPAGDKQIKFAVTEGFESVEIETTDGKQTLKIKKPGKAMLSLEYDGVTVTQAVEVLKRTISVSGITAEDKTYDGTTNIGLTDQTPVVSGTLENETINLSYNCELESAGAGDAVPVKITVTATGMADGKDFKDYYTVAVAPVTAKVSKAALTVKTQTITEINYNGTMPSFDVDYSGFVNGETVADLNGTLQFDCPATSTSLKGNYTVTPYGLTSNNYAIKYEGATLTIKAVAPTVEIVSATVSNDKSTVTVKGHVTNNGGTETIKLKGGFKVGNTEQASNLDVDKNGYFTAALTGLGNTEVNLIATATAPESLVGTSTTDFKVNLALEPQNVRFVTNLTRLVYGSKVTLAAADYAADAEVKFAVSEGGVLTLGKDGKTITATMPGTATITVTAEKQDYITATAKQTVVVEPKSVTINPYNTTKKYDGELDIEIGYGLVGILPSDNIWPDNDQVKFMFLDKNVGTNKPIVTTGPLKLRGTNAGCYTMVQPTNLTGSITSGDNVTVTVSNVHRKYNESALHYSLSFTANGQPIKPIYTGQITVTENNGQWTASLNNVQFPNYGAVSLASTSGTVEIEKGTPKVLTYTSAANTVAGLLVDNEGWTDVQDDGTETDTNGTFAKFKYDNGRKSVRGASLTPPSTLTAHTWTITKNTRMRAAALRAETETELNYGETATLTKVGGFAYSVSNPAVITLTENSGDYTINAVGVGSAAVIAEKEGTVVYHRIKVSPATLTIGVSNMDKTYDGTTVANPSLTINETVAGVALDLSGISFNYASANAGTGVTINPTQPIALTGANAANYKVNASSI